VKTGLATGGVISMMVLIFMGSGFITPSKGFPAAKGKMREIIIWPPEVLGWKWDLKENTFKGKSLYRYIDGAAEVYLAYNFQQVFTGRYSKPDHPEILADIYRMGSSEDAFGVFSLEQQDPEVGIGQGSEFGGNLLRFWKGRYFVTVQGNGEGKGLEKAILDLGRELAKGIQETGSIPKLLNCLPGQDHLPPVERICFLRSHILLNRCFFISHQNLLGLGPEVEAIIARYSIGKNKLRILLLRYPSISKARSAFKNFQNTYFPEVKNPSSVRTEDGLWTRAETFQNLVLVLFGVGEETEAERLSKIILKKAKGESS
jgi:hypothetical protein